MIQTTDFIEGIKSSGIKFITGVPDSLLKEVCAHIDSEFQPPQHLIATNEGSAVGLAIGSYLGTGVPAMVYMQNSGIGNALNPLISLTDPQVYGIPMVLLIGWRAEMSDEFGQIFDEPQHRKQGEITLELLKVLDIPYIIIDSQTKDVQAKILTAANEALSRSGPIALVVRKGTFHKFDSSPDLKKFKFTSRENAIKSVVANLPSNTSVISTTGMISRELYEIRKSNNLAEGLDFLTVGGMGHASQIATGLALTNPEKKVVCLDGDGAILMHTGALATSADCSNLFHIVLNNGVHDSVGGQPTKGQSLRFDLIASSFGYKNTEIILSLDDFNAKFKQLFNNQGSSFLEIRCAPGSRENIGRPDNNLIERKKNFMNFVGIKN